MRIINVAFICDTRGLKKALVAMFSVLQSRAAEDYIQFYFVADEGFTARDLETLSILNGEFSKIELVTVKSSEYNWLLAKSKTHLPLNAYYRIDLAKLLPQVERIIYLDYDVLVRDSLWDLYNLELNGLALAAVVDTDDDWWCQQHREIHQIHLQHYYNSGVLLLDLEKWRRDQLDKQIWRFAQELNRGTDSTFTDADQFLLNCALQSEILAVDYRWNLQIWQNDLPIVCADLGAWEQAIAKPAIVHFLGALNKPWYFALCKNRFMYEWWRIAQLTPNYTELFTQALGTLLERKIDSTQWCNLETTLELWLKLRRHCRWYQWLSRCSFGGLKQKYRAKYLRTQEQLQQLFHTSE